MKKLLLISAVTVISMFSSVKATEFNRTELKMSQFATEMQQTLFNNFQTALNQFADMEQQLNEKQNQLNSVSQELTIYKRSNERQGATIQTISEKAHEIEKLNQTLTEQNQNLQQQLAQEQKDKERVVADYQKASDSNLEQLKEAYRQIETLKAQQSQGTQYQTQIQNLQQEIESLNNMAQSYESQRQLDAEKVKQLEDQLETKRTELESREIVLNEKAQEIEQLKQQLEQQSQNSGNSSPSPAVQELQLSNEVQKMLSVLNTQGIVKTQIKDPHNPTIDEVKQFLEQMTKSDRIIVPWQKLQQSDQETTLLANQPTIQAYVNEMGGQFQ